MRNDVPTDRELIEWAAKAFFGKCYKGQIKWTEHASDGFWEALTEGQTFDDLLGFQHFDPLASNSSAFEADSVSVHSECNFHHDEDCSDPVQKCALVRRAIVRATADFGKMRQ